MKKRLFLLAHVCMCAAVLFACRADPTPDESLIYTQAAQTMAAKLTQTALAFTATHLPSLTPTPEPSFTPSPTQTATPSATNTPTPSPRASEIVIPTAILIRTPTPSLTPQPSSTTAPTSIPCDQMRFIDHITVVDGSVVSTGAQFTKTWRVENTGSCVWTRDYALVFSTGNRMGGQQVVNLSSNVLPGQRVDLSVTLNAPVQPGDYEGSWLLRNEVGDLFGSGTRNTPLRVSIEAVDVKNQYVLDFALTYCTASWESAANDLPCPGNPSSPDGSVTFLGSPALENSDENEPALFVRPNTDNNGWISGIYPPIQIVAGDRFRAWIGCLDGSRGCEVIFQLDYQVSNGPIQNLDTWEETYDGEVTEIDLDLSSLAGQNVRFILTVIVGNNRPEAANAFWFVPRVQRP